MRRTAGSVAALTVAAMLAACSSGSSTPEEGVSTDAPVGQIRYESWTPTQDAFNSIVAAFTDEYPDVEVQGTLSPFEDYQTSLQTQLRSGAGPDVFVVQPGAMLNQFREYIEPIDSYAAEFGGEDWADVFNPEPLARARVDAQTYGLPVGYGVAGFLWVNTSLLAEHGLSAPTTYDELLETSAALEQAGVAPIAFGGRDAWQAVDYYLAIAASKNGEALYAALDGEASWDDPDLIDAFAAYEQLFADGTVQDGAAGAATYTDTYDLFTQGKAAFFANGSWNLDMFVNSLDLVQDFEIDAIPLPVPGSDDTAPIIGDVTGIVVVNKNSENKSAAFQLARFMSQGDGAQILTDAALDFPVTKDGPSPQNLPEAALAARGSIEDLIATDLAGYRQVPSATVNTALGDVLAGLVTSDLTPEEAASRVQEAADNA